MKDVKLEKSPARKTKRDSLQISIPMGYIIIGLGFICDFVNCLLSGFSLFFVFCSYAVLDKYEYLNYYSETAPTISKMYVYISLAICIIEFTYVVFAWIVLPALSQKILFSCSFVCSIIVLALSLGMVEVDEVLCAMNRRTPQWWLDEENTVYDSWNSTVFVPHKTKDIFRAIFILIQAITYVFGFQFSLDDFLTGFDI